MKLSIIIPMYNAEKYIEACLDSILNSDLPKEEYEVIIVNDGSKDKGPEIAQEYCEKHDNFIYLTQENQGQSVARNHGIKESHGEYVWFVDSDDKIDGKINEILVKIDGLGKPDVFSFFLQYVSEEDKFLTKAFSFPGEYNKLMRGRDAVMCGFQPSSVCVYFIKRSFINDKKLNFYPGIYHQDSEFSYKMMAYAGEVYFSDYVPYIYIKHENSVVTSTSPEKILKKQLDDIIIMNSFINLSSSLASIDIELSEKIRCHVDDMAFGSVYTLFAHRKTWKKQGISKAVVEQLKINGYYPLREPYGSWKKRLAAMFLNIECIVS